MQFSLTESLKILEKTPEVLHSQISAIPHEWIFINEGTDKWNVFDIAGHFVYIEKNNWIPRTQILLFGNEKLFDTLNPLGHVEECKDNSIDELLTEFKTLRKASIEKLKSYQINSNDLTKTANHPVLGTVTLSQLLATWVVHDLSHLAQISRVVAKQYKDAVGPFSEFLRILKY